MIIDTDCEHCAAGLHYCPHDGCGEYVGHTAKFCPYCGGPVADGVDSSLANSRVFNTGLLASLETD